MQTQRYLAQTEAPEDGTPSLRDPWELPGIIGRELARATAGTESILQQFQKKKFVSRTDVGTLLAAADAIRRIAIHSQQISRLAEGRLRQSHERLNLQQLVRRVLLENDWRYYQAGLQIEQHLQQVEVIVDPGLLVSLCEAAIDCAACYGQVLTVWLSTMNWPEHGLLTIQARPHVVEAGRPQAPEGEVLDWVYVSRLAQAMGVEVRREVFEDRAVITLRFPRTVKHLQGLTAIEVDDGESAPGADDSRPLAGHRLLLVAADSGLRWELQAICRNMRLVLDTVPTCAEAIRYCERDKPDLIVVDEPVRDGDFELLRKDLLRYNVNFPCVEIAAAPNVVEMASWDGEQISRISRDALRAQMPSILAVELAKVF